MLVLAMPLLPTAHVPHRSQRQSWWSHTHKHTQTHTHTHIHTHTQRQIDPFCHPLGALSGSKRTRPAVWHSSRSRPDVCKSCFGVFLRFCFKVHSKAWLTYCDVKSDQSRHFCDAGEAICRARRTARTSSLTPSRRPLQFFWRRSSCGYRCEKTFLCNPLQSHTEGGTSVCVHVCIYVSHKTQELLQDLAPSVFCHVSLYK